MKCAHCGAVLTRHSAKNHARLWCPVTAGVEMRSCANTRKDKGRGCKEVFQVKPSNPRQAYCCRKCNQQMRPYPSARTPSDTRGMSAEQRNDLHMAPLRRLEQEAVARSAEVRLITGEASFRLWADLLGLRAA